MQVIQMCWKNRRAVTVSNRSADSKAPGDPDTPAEATGKNEQAFQAQVLWVWSCFSVAAVETINEKHPHRTRDQEMVKPGPPKDRGQSETSHVQIDIAIQ